MSFDDANRTDDRKPYSRSHHRSRAHESAHAEGAGEPVHIPEHPLIPRDAGELITTDSALAEFIDHLRVTGSFAYDSEFIGELTYHPKLCVIQVASSQRIALIDPLSEIELRPFWELLADPSVRKIVHAGEQDIEPVVRELGCAAANMFDTQIAAGMAGFPYPAALSKLVFELAHAKLGKGLTFSHWDQRPLSAMQLRYAADDVRYLPMICAEIGTRLDKLGHAQWAEEECAARCDPALYRFDPDRQYLRIRGAGSLDPRNQAVLRALFAWRDAAARNADVPPRAYLRDEILLDMARTPVKSVDRLERVRGLPRPVEIDQGAAIVEATLRALALPTPSLPVAREIEPLLSEKFRGDSLWSAAQAICAAQGIDPALVLSRQDMSDFWQVLRTGTPPKDHPLMQGWRRAALGQPLLDLVNGDRSYALAWSEGFLRLR